MENEVIVSALKGTIQGMADPITKSVNSHLDRKFENIESEKERNFIAQQKNIEFYKDTYTKEINKIFDYWIEMIRLSHIKDNNNLKKAEKENIIKKYNTNIKVSKIAEMNTLTLKYANVNTVRVLATNNFFNNYEKENMDYISLYGFMKLFATLKEDILNIKLTPLEILSIYTNDIFQEEQLDKFNEAKKKYEDKYKELVKIFEQND